MNLAAVAIGLDRRILRREPRESAGINPRGRVARVREKRRQYRPDEEAR